MRLEYEAGVVGTDKVRRNLRSIEQEVRRHGKATNQAVKSATRERIAETRQAKTAAQKAWEGIAKIAASEQRRLHREKLQHIKREEREKIAAERRASRVSEQEQKRADRAALMAARGAARERERMFASRNRSFGRGVATTLGSGVGRVVGLGSSALALGGGFGVAMAAQRKIQDSLFATQIANRAAVVPGETKSRERLTGEIFGAAEKVETETGRKREVTLEGVDRFLEKTGAIEAAMKLIPRLSSEVADGMGLTDESFGDLAQSAGILFAGIEQQGVKGEAAIESTMKTMRKLAGQSAVGQIGIPDIAKELPKLLAAASRFGGDPGDNIASMTGLANIATAVAAKGPEEATTAAMRFTDDLFKKSKKLKKRGINVLDEKGNLKDSRELITELVIKGKGLSKKGMGGQVPALQEVFGIRGFKMIESFAKNTREMGPEAAEKEFRSSLDKFLKANVTDEDIKKGAAAVHGSDARRIAKQMQELDRAIANDFVPVLMNDLLPALKELSPHIKDASTAVAGFVGWFADNPLRGIGAIIAASVAKDVAAAGIGAVIAKGMAAILAGTRFGGALGGAGAGAAGGLGGAAGAAGAAGKGAVGGAGMAAGGLAAAGLVATVTTGLALDQLQELNKEMGGSGESLNPLADKKGEMSVGATLSNLLGTASFGMLGEQGGVHKRVGTSLGEVIAGFMRDEDAEAIKRAEERKGQGAPGEGPAGQVAVAQAKPDQAALDEAMVGAANKAGDALVNKLNAWTPPKPGPNRDGTPIVKQ